VFSDLRLAEKMNHVEYEEEMIAWVEEVEEDVSGDEE
jgi:hypothetical protein